ncbi:EamA family transporter RarD [Streptomyces sp. NRRL F-5727]|uniref:EamA family transporter RarD n=1 Tax=Streptomyces sp. NRRL F-5727 TaxID=1463871 RepID=UPI0006923C49|nr:EamA family transporter RarD [Streptomyces sp. NRRL F-5727]
MNAPTPSVPASGIASSVGASVIFGTIFMIPPHLLPLDPEQILGYRIVAMVAFLAAFFCVARMWDQAAALVGRLRATPHLVGVLVLDAALLGLQLWLFGWAPQSGHGLDLSLGYLILPLVMVVVSVVVYREKLSRRRIAAVLCAAAGVTAAVVLAGGLRWPTLLVALGLPLYFVSRRAFALDSAAAQLLELTAMLPFSVLVLTVKPSLDTVIHRPRLIAGLVLLGLLSAAGFALYLTASRVLPFSLFGVLGYVEPVLLVLVSLTFLGEPWQPADSFVYLPICAGLVLLALEPTAGESGAPKHPAPRFDSACA